MKIYFEDGRLRDWDLTTIDYDHEIDAKDGYACNREDLNNILSEMPGDVVYTNSLVALDNRYCWNDKLKVPELHIRTGREQ